MREQEQARKAKEQAQGRQAGRQGRRARSRDARRACVPAEPGRAIPQTQRHVKTDDPDASILSLGLTVAIGAGRRLACRGARAAPEESATGR